jgi:hypothetical protein
LPQRFTKANHPQPLEENEPKRTQFQNGQYKHKYSKNKGLCQRTTHNEQRTLFKTNPIKPTNPFDPSTMLRAGKLRTCLHESARRKGDRRQWTEAEGKSSPGAGIVLGFGFFEQEEPTAVFFLARPE